MDDAPSWSALRRRSGDLRGVGDLQLERLENGPGRDRRLLIGRNGAGLGFEIAVDRGLDLAGLSWRGVNLGWRGPAGPGAASSPALEAGLGLLRDFDGALVTCGLDHYGPPETGPAAHFAYEHRPSAFYPLHGRIGQTPATLSGYGLEAGESPVLWCEGEVRQSALFAEHLVLRRRIEVSLWSPRLRVGDEVINRGFEPVPHAMLYHVNLGYPLLDEGALLIGQLGGLAPQVPAPPDGARELVDEVAIEAGRPAQVGLSNPKLGMQVGLGFDPAQLPGLAVWRSWRSGLYALGLEPKTALSKDVARRGPHRLEPGESRRYDLSLEVAATGPDRG